MDLNTFSNFNNEDNIGFPGLEKFCAKKYF